MTAPVPEVPDRSTAIAADVALIADALLHRLVDVQGDPPGPDREYRTRVEVARAAVRLGALTDPGLLANLSSDREVRRHGRALLPAARLHADLASYVEEPRG